MEATHDILAMWYAIVYSRDDISGTNYGLSDVLKCRDVVWILSSVYRNLLS